MCQILFIFVIAECGNLCVRGDGPLFESVLLTTVHMLYRHNSIILCNVAYYTCNNFDESDGPEVPWGILIGLPHHYFPHETRIPS